MKNIKLLFICIVVVTSLSSCVHRKSPQENLEDLKNGKVAAVISGCAYTYEDSSPHLSASDNSRIVATECRASWVSAGNKCDNLKEQNGTDVNFKDEFELLFIPPGTYSFCGFIAHEPYKTVYFNENIKSSTYLTNFTVKGGEVIYIGSLDINAANSNRIVEILNVNKLKSNVVKRLFKESYGDKYLQLVSKLKIRYVDLTPKALVGRNILRRMPLIE